MKVPLFQAEMAVGNRWVLARAVLTVTPSFGDGDPTRLAKLKALASRCLTKDLDARLQIVQWEDFVLVSEIDPLVALKSRLEKIAPARRNSVALSPLDAKLRFERTEFEKTFIDRVRAEMIAQCEAKMPLSVQKAPSAPTYQFAFRPVKGAQIQCQILMEWLGGMYLRTARIKMSCNIYSDQGRLDNHEENWSLLGTVTMGQSEDQSVYETTRAMAEALNRALDVIGGRTDLSELFGVDPR